ncbi:MAG: 2-hydroxy-3-oxopropionate reductase [Clostridia bacterium]|nr:2-hydroxy-3-oxopropionate reductase [Clostridia bacterium]
MKIGFIGLGIMGRPMAKNLLKAGYELVVADKFAPAAVEDVVACGAKAGASNMDVGSQVDILITMVPNSPNVKEALFGEDGAAKTLKKGAIVLDCSSINPIASREIYAELQKLDIEMLDCPVSGGEPKAIDGTLAFMVGGKQEIFDQCKDILAKMGSSVVLCGDIGAGNVTKLCNQIVVAINIAGLAEAMMLGQMAGVEPEKIFEAIKGGLAGSTVMNAKAPMMMDQNFKPGFRINLHIKDLNNVVDAASVVDAPIPLTQAVLEMMKVLKHDGDAGCDHSALLKYYQKLTGETLHH